MDSHLSRKVWKKRAVIGYHPKDSREMMEYIQKEFSEEIKQLQSQLSKKKENIKQMRERCESMQNESANSIPKEEQIKTHLFQKLIESSEKLNNAREYYDKELGGLNKHIEEKKMERDQIVEQLKTTLQQLHESLAKLEGGGQNERKPTSILPFRLKKKSN